MVNCWFGPGGLDTWDLFMKRDFYFGVALESQNNPNHQLTISWNEMIFNK